MGALTRGSELIGADRRTWRRLATSGSTGGAALSVVGAFALLAFDRFGFQGFLEPRATVRIVLIGFYGWMWLAAATWLAARFVLGREQPFSAVARLTGYAHLPLLVAGFVIQFVSVSLRTFGPAWLVWWLVLLAWMPALLVAAARETFTVDNRVAVVLAAFPYMIWLLVVGRTLTMQLAHLL